MATEPKRCLTCNDSTHWMPCGAVAAVNSGDGWRCCEHVQIAPEHHLLTEDQILSIIAMAVAAAENACQAGHDWKQDEVSLGVWERVLRALGQEGEAKGG